MSATLEQRIATAFSSETASDVVEALIGEVETAAAAADKAAEQTRQRALDPTVIDAATRREAEDASFTRDRLRAALSPLEERLQQVQAAEHGARWETDFEQVEGRLNELAQEYAATYPRLAAQFVDLFERIEAVDKEVSRVNGSAPEGEHRRLRQTELVARGLDNFSRADPPITKAVQLPDWTNSEKMVWPPPRPSLAVQVATSMTYGPNPGADWWQESKDRAQAMREEHARVIEHYDAMECEREERENAEAASVAAEAARRSRA